MQYDSHVKDYAIALLFRQWFKLMLQSQVIIGFENFKQGY